MTSTSLEHMFNQLQLQGMCAVYINTCVRVVFKLGLDPSWLALAALSYVTALVNCYVVDQILPNKNDAATLAVWTLKRSNTFVLLTQFCHACNCAKL